jgi:SsrA-binding protein
MSTDISVNRKALRDFHILDRFEAGIELVGTEVKAIRSGLANVNNAFARVENGQVWLYDMDIQAYEKASFVQHEPKRQRRLLLHRQEIEKLLGKTQIEGHSIVALRVYWKGHRVKVEIGVGKGKHAHDKRQDLKAKAEKRETDRVVAGFNKQRGR